MSTLIILQDSFEGSEVKFSATGWKNKHDGEDKPGTNHPDNFFEISTEQAHSGSKSLKCVAYETSGISSKTSLIDSGYKWYPGTVVTMKCWFYIPSGQNIKNMTILDLEAREIWAEDNVISNQSPGLRLQYRDNSGTLKVDRGKIGISEPITQVSGSEILTPFDEWFEIGWATLLGEGDAGISVLKINEQTAINKKGTTIPLKKIYAASGVTLTDELYDSYEMGISSHQSSGTMTIYADDFELSIMDLAQAPSEPVASINPSSALESPQGLFKKKE